MKKSSTFVKSELDRSTLKDIEGFEGLYGITRDGIIISYGGKSNHNDDIILKCSYDKDGYRRVTLQRDGIKRYFRVCRLVASSFIPNPNNLPIVNHIDENKQNDSADNLEWCTELYNWEYSSGHLKQRVYKCDMEGNIIESYESLMEASRQNNCRQGNISNCIKGRCKSTGGFKWKLC